MSDQEQGSVRDVLREPLPVQVMHRARPAELVARFTLELSNWVAGSASAAEDARRRVEPLIEQRGEAAAEVGRTRGRLRALAVAIPIATALVVVAVLLLIGVF
ncbi:MAG: hypothetical protein AB7L91_18105 [Dehalococcoidia bacterium]